MQVPYLLNGFHPVVPFKEVEDNNEENNDNGLINIDNLHLDDTAIVDSNV